MGEFITLDALREGVGSRVSGVKESFKGLMAIFAVI
jgi:hypothetical protein